MPLARRLRKASFRAAAWLCCARPRLWTDLKAEGDEQIGINIIRRACEEPLRQIAGNAGVEGAIVIEKVRSNNESELRLQRRHRQVRGPGGAGVIDPTKVTRTALQNASSIAALMLTTEAMVAEIPEKKRLRRRRRPRTGDGLLS